MSISERGVKSVQVRKQYIHNFILLPSIVLSFIHNFCYDD